MTITVDLVIAGVNQQALDAAIDSARGGKRVLIITRRRGPELRRRIREARRIAGGAVSKQISILAAAEVECVAGVRSVEAVLARFIGTGRRIDINATSLLTFEDDAETEMASQKKEIRNVICSGC